MCVVLICPPKQRPDLTILRACHAANPHGAGVAWRDKRRIHWKKALTTGEVSEGRFALVKSRDETIILGLSEV